MTLNGSALAPSGVSPFAGDYTWFAICEPDLTTVGSGRLFDGLGTNNLLAYFLFDRQNQRVVWFLGTSTVNSSGGVTQALQPVTLWSGLAANGTPNGTATLYKNGSQLATGSVGNWSSRTDGFSMFAYGNGSGNTMAGTASEFVWYSSQQAGRAAIESEMMRHYSV